MARGHFTDCDLSNEQVQVMISPTGEAKVERRTHREPEGWLSEWQWGTGVAWNRYYHGHHLTVQLDGLGKIWLTLVDGHVVLVGGMHDPLELAERMLEEYADYRARDWPTISQKEYCKFKLSWENY